MGKVHPQASVSSNSALLTSKKETFTVWMKSLVMNGKGCTVFDSNGKILYRVDNYNNKSRDEVCLMDSEGRVLFTIRRKKNFKLFRFWEGYRSKNTPELPGFKARKAFRISGGESPCVITVGLEKNQPRFTYIIQSSSDESTVCNILDKFGRPIAEVKRKQSSKGMDFGEDVLQMVVEPFVDHCLVMAFFVVYSLFSSKM